MSMPQQSMPPQGVPPQGAPPRPGSLATPPGSGSGLSLPGGLPGGGPPPMVQAIMRMLPPQAVQAIAANPSIIPQLVQRFLPMLLGSMPQAANMTAGQAAVRAAGPPRGFPPRPGAYTGNGPPAPPAQGAIGAGQSPMSTEDELAETQRNMGSRGRNA